MAAKISVITPVWNKSDLTLRYLYQQLEADIELIIIDNGSTDNTPVILANWRKEMRVITNEENLGFPIACNQGANVATGDILLFLNNDILIYGDYVGRIREAVDDNILAGPELNAHETGWNRFGSKIIPYIAGWCLALTKATYDLLGGFDERYSPCDYEDIDLCYRAVMMGKGLAQLSLPVKHLSGQTGQQLANRQSLTEINRRKFAEKWDL